MRSHHTGPGEVIACRLCRDSLTSSDAATGMTTWGCWRNDLGLLEGRHEGDGLRRRQGSRSPMRYGSAGMRLGIVTTGWTARTFSASITLQSAVTVSAIRPPRLKTM